MGSYLEKPVTTKETEELYYPPGEKTQNCIHCVSTSMQGWRTTMEDEHITHFNFEPGMHLFAVFDGHGGSEVSYFVKQNFEEELRKSYRFSTKDYGMALS